MDWCRTHPTYSAKREPNSLCGRCWTLYLYRCPERKPGDLRLMNVPSFEDLRQPLNREVMYGLD